jgi:hypothetical protein
MCEASPEYTPSPWRALQEHLLRATMILPEKDALSLIPAWILSRRVVFGRWKRAVRVGASMRGKASTAFGKT